MVKLYSNQLKYVYLPKKKFCEYSCSTGGSHSELNPAHYYFMALLTVNMKLTCTAI